MQGQMSVYKRSVSERDERLEQLTVELAASQVSSHLVCEQAHVYADDIGTYHCMVCCSVTLYSQMSKISLPPGWVDAAQPSPAPRAITDLALGISCHQGQIARTYVSNMRSDVRKADYPQACGRQGRDELSSALRVSSHRERRPPQQSC